MISQLHLSRDLKTGITFVNCILVGKTMYDIPWLKKVAKVTEL